MGVAAGLLVTAIVSAGVSFGTALLVVRLNNRADHRKAVNESYQIVVKNARSIMNASLTNLESVERLNKYVTSLYGQTENSSGCLRQTEELRQLATHKVEIVDAKLRLIELIVRNSDRFEDSPEFQPGAVFNEIKDSLSTLLDEARPKQKR